jgi:hypothetical protein
MEIVVSEALFNEDSSRGLPDAVKDVFWHAAIFSSRKVRQ